MPTHVCVDLCDCDLQGAAEQVPRPVGCFMLQDIVAGDGTTSVTVICGALLKKCLDLLERGVHPTVISDAFLKAAQKANEVCFFSSI